MGICQRSSDFFVLILISKGTCVFETFKGKQIKNRPFYSCVLWPLNRSEADGDLVLLQTFLLFMCKSWYSHANKPVNMIIYI